MQLDIYVYFLPSLEDVDVTDQQFTFLTILYTFLAALLVYSLICLASFSSNTFRSLSGVYKFTWCAKATKVLYFPLPILMGYWSFLRILLTEPPRLLTLLYTCMLVTT